MANKLLRTIANGENESLDFKQTISDAHKIAKTIVAFANHKGGTLLIGVRDNGSICGTRSEDDKYMLELAGHFYCEPKIDIAVKEHEIDGKTVLEATIEAGQNKPYYAKDQDGKWWVYYRVNDKSLQASAVMYQVLRKQNRAHTEISKYSQLEAAILQCFKTKAEWRLKELSEVLGTKRNRVVYSLAKLIHFDLLKVVFHNQEEYYALSA
jgi:predicted HTH transcriptional regulator